MAAGGMDGGGTKSLKKERVILVGFGTFSVGRRILFLTKQLNGLNSRPFFIGLNEKKQQKN